MKKQVLFFAALSLGISAFSQQIGTPQWAANHPTSAVERQAGPSVAPLNGNDSLSTVYSNTDCGLTYTTATVRLGQRFIPAGVAQPAPMNIAMPSCAVIDKAYLYTECLGVAPSINATLTDPLGNSSTYPMSLIGSSIDVCWGMNGTHVWRADVTSSVTGPGVYQISGLPVNPNNSTVDVEGATLIVIYKDPYSGATGTLILDDGCYTVAGGSLNYTMTGFSACANSTSANAFMLVGDMQMSGYSLSMNNQAVTQPQWDWWNEISASTSVTNGQSTCDYSLNSAGDCYTLAVAGLYFQTGCNTCTPLTTNLNINTTSTPNSCNGNGSASATVTGGSGNYTYLWMPGGQTTSTATNLATGTYTVYVNDGTSCASATVTVGYTGMNISTTATNVSCASSGSITATVSGGVGPFTYSWAPSGGTGATASGLAAGAYTVTVTDQGTGCTMTEDDTIYNVGSMSVMVFMYPDSCGPGNSGMGSAYVQGGTGPYTYLWQPGGQTTPTITGLGVGSYTCTVTDAGGCTATDTGSVTSAQATIFTTYNYFACGDSAQLYCYTNAQNATYSWSPGGMLDDSTSASPVGLNIMSATTFTVTVNSSCGTLVDTLTVVPDSINWFNEEICFVTIDTATNHNLVIWERWNSPSTGSYNIYRETSTTGVFALIASQPVSQFTTYLDNTSNPSVSANRYLITTVDACGNESDTSVHHRTIYLSTSPNGGGFDLMWTAYEGLPVTQYNIYRGPALNQLSLLTTVSGFYYLDANPPAGTNVYLVEAVNPFGACNPSRVMNGGPVMPFEYSSSLSNAATAVPSGINDQSLLQNSFSVTPNPGNGIFQLNFTVAQQQDVQITVFDNLGQSVYAKTATASANTNTVAIDLSSLSKGVYLVQVKTENGIATKRLVVE